MEERRERRQFWVHVRMGIIASIITAMFAAVVARVYYLQTVEKGHLVEKATDQSHRSIKLKAKRGSILDRNGVELAVSVESPSIAVRPKLIPDKEAAATALADAVGMDVAAVRKKLASKSAFVWLKRQASPDAGEAVKALELKGAEVHLESKRFYPLKGRAGQLLGFTNIDGLGLEGLERSLETELAGGEYTISGVRDARGRTILTDETPEFDKFEGNTVVTTIDERIQRVAEEALAEQVEKHDAKGGFAVVLEPETGDILALANTPDFDPNHYRLAKAGDWRLRGVTDTFEPGSTFKPFVLAGALQEGTMTLNTPVDCENGRIRIGKYTIRDSHASGVISAAEVVQHSSNIGAYKIAQSYGREKFYQTIKAFGFGSSPGSGLRGEQAGLVWPPDRWAEVSFANIAFGQGLTATPLQVASATAVVANGGLLMKPRVVKKIVDKDGETVRDNPPTLVRRVISPEVARQTAWAMSLVTRPGGTAKRAAMEHFNVAGKTGTAQKVNPETRRYDPDMWLGSFVGFVPAEDPRVVIAVIIDEPQDTHYGGVVAAPAFKKIATEAISVLHVVPVPVEEQFKYDGEEVAVAEQPAAEPIELEASAVEAAPMQVAEGGVPDFRGLTLRKSLEKAREYGVLPRVQGWGRVVSQEPEAGTPIAEGVELSLVLTPGTRQSLVAEEPSLGSVD